MWMHEKPIPIEQVLAQHGGILQVNRATLEQVKQERDTAREQADRYNDRIIELLEQKQFKVNVWHNLLMDAVKMHAPESILRILKKHLERARGD